MKPLLFSALLLFTLQNLHSQNLLVNPSAELPLTTNGWSQVSGDWKQGQGSAVPKEGSFYFFAGASATGELFQEINVSSYASLIDGGKAYVTYSGHMRSYDQFPVDEPSQIVEYLDESNAILDTYSSGVVRSRTAWASISDTRLAPVKTRKIRVRLLSKRLVGTNNDGYHDDLSLTISNKAPQTITLTPISDKIITDASFNVQATSSSGLQVSLIIQTAPAIGVASISGNSITLLGNEGTVYVIADQPGNQDYQPAATVRDTFTVKKPPMKFVSATTTQTVFTGMRKNSLNNLILGIQVVASGSTSPIAPLFNFTTNGTSNPEQNITRAKLFYTGANRVINMQTIAGTVLSPKGAFSIASSRPLVADDTTFYWLVYDVPQSAANGAILDAELVSLNAGGIKTPQVQAPSGARFVCTTPIITSTSPTKICEGDSIALTSDITQNIKWSTGQTTATIYVHSPGSYYVVYSDSASCATVSNKITFTADKKPVLNIDGAALLCKGDTVQLNVTNAATVLWSTGQTTSAIKVSPADTTTYSVTSTTAQGCVTKDSATINVIEVVSPGAVTNMLPVNGALDASNFLQLSWSPGQNASDYDVYIWPSNTSRPAVPSIANVKRINTTYQKKLSYGTTYNWQVVSKNSCRQTEGVVQTFTMRELPDLVVDHVQTPLSILSGQQINLSWEVKNIGGGSTNAKSWNDVVFLSFDTALNTNTDIRLGVVANPGYLAPGESYVQTASFRIPENISGNYILFVKTDNGNYLLEQNEDNNHKRDAAQTFLSITIPARPDLIVSSLATPSSTFGGNSINVSYSVTNTGPANAAGSLRTFTARFPGQLGLCYLLERNWKDAIYISADSVFSLSKSTLLSEVYVGFRSAKINVGPTCPDLSAWNNLPDYLAPDSSYNKVISVTIPHSFFGNYYIFVITDRYSIVSELAEINNLQRTSRIAVTLKPPPDLVVSTVTIPATSTSGDTVKVSWRVVNEGANAPVETSWNDKVYLSKAESFDKKSALLLGAVRKYGGNKLSPDSAYVQNIGRKLPDGISGDYYVYIYTDNDNDVFEYRFDSNNIRRSVQPVQVALSPYPDLSIASAIVPSVAETEKPFELTWTVKNQGEAKVSSSWTDRVYWSKNPDLESLIIKGKVLLTLKNTSALQAGDSVVKKATILLPKEAEGTVYLQISTDAGNTVYEHLDENNNYLPLAKKIIVSPSSLYADLKISKLILPGSIHSGDTIDITYSVQNIGNAITNSSSSWYDRIHVSADNIRDKSDKILGAKTYSGILHPDSLYTRTISVVVPNGLDGQYHLFITADETGVIKNEKNSLNNLEHVVLNVSLTPTPDLLIKNITSPNTLLSGQELTLQYTVKNEGIGESRSGRWTDYLFLSTTTDLSRSSYFIGKNTRTGTLPAGSSYTAYVLVAIPEYLSGNYYLVVVTDYSKSEYEGDGESNNLAYKPLSVQFPKPANLVVSNITLPKSISLGDNVTVNYKVTNIGSNPAIGKLRDAVFLSTDSSFSGGVDKLLLTKDQQAAIAPGASIENTIVTQMPGVLDSSYYGIASTNTLHTVKEIEFSDNKTATDSKVNVSIPQLKFNTKETKTLSKANNLFFKLAAQENTDLLIDLKSNQSTGANEIYVSFGRIPTPSDYDYAFEQTNSTAQQVLVSSTKKGFYYIFIRTLTNFITVQQVEITARTLPFTVLSITSNKVGKGVITTAVRGAVFDTSTVFSLRSVTGAIVSTGITKKIYNSMRADVQWDLTNIEVGSYDVFARNTSKDTTSLTNGLHVEKSSGFVIDYNYIAPELLRAGKTGSYSLYFRNKGNIDIPVILGDLTVLPQTTIVKFETTGNVKSRSELANLNNLFTKVEEYVLSGDGKTIPFVADHLRPDETFVINLVVSHFTRANFPVRIRAFGYSTNAFLNRQASFSEMMRKSILNNNNLPANASFVKNIALDSLAFRDSIFAIYQQAGLFTQQDVNNASIAICDSCINREFGQNEPESEGGFTFDPAPGTNISTYNNLVFNAGQNYFWEINEYNGTPGDSPGWDLIHVAGPLEITATPASRFRIQLGATDAEDNLNKLLNWSPSVDKCWPIVVANGGITGFDTSKFYIDVSLFSKYNPLNNGKFSLRLGGSDTLLLCFIAHKSSGGRQLQSSSNRKSGIEEKQIDNLNSKILDDDPPPLIDLDDPIPCGATDELYQGTCNVVFDGLGCGASIFGCAGLAFVPVIGWWGAATCAIGLGSCFNSVFRGPNIVDLGGVDLVDCLLGGVETADIVLGPGLCAANMLCNLVVSSCDPNEIIGPNGYGEKKFIAANSLIPYTIRFENDSKIATAPAQKVEIRQVLNEHVNPLSFRLGDFEFANFSFSVPQNTASYFQVLNLPDSLGYDVEVTAGIDITTNEAFWVLQTIDPITGLPPIDPLKGLLPVNDSSSIGEGFVSYTVKPKSAVHTGDSIYARATIVFDVNEPIATPVIFNTVDDAKPVSKMKLLPPIVDSTTIALNWSGQDDTGGSGIAYYSLYVSEDGGPYALHERGIVDTTTIFEGAKGKTYCFFILANDNVGNEESLKSDCEASVHLVDNRVTSVKDGNWSNPTIWSNNKVPDSLSSLLVKHNIVVDVNAECESLELTKTGTMKLNNGIKLKVLTKR